MYPTENEPINYEIEPINQENTDTVEPIKHTFEIEYSKFPLPDKYKGIISSGDG